MRVRSRAASAAALVLLAAVISCDSKTPSDPVVPGTLAVAAASSTVEVLAGSNATVGITVTRGGSFTGPVTLGVSGLPTGVTAEFTPATLTSGTTGELRLTAEQGLPESTSTITVRATGSGVDEAATALTLTVIEPPPAIAVLEGDTQRVAAGTAVSVAPAVVIRRPSGAAVEGMQVVFEVTGGGGAVTGGTATTDAQGVARVGSWTLGTGLGANTLRASAEGTQNGSVTFTATSVTGAASQIAAHAGADQTAAAGTAVATAPAVRVTDAQGHPVAGVTVTFAVTAGAGSVANATATTDSAGIATAGGWTLGTGLGTNTLRASLPEGAATVDFTATAVAGAPAEMSVVAGAGQTVAIGQSVRESPAVRVTDRHGHPVPAQAVVFEVTGGGGTVTGASTQTDTAGIARAGVWTLGSEPGTQTLTARAGSISAAITATAHTCLIESYTIGSEVTGAWTSTDCMTDEAMTRRHDEYGFTITEQTAFRAFITGPEGRRVRLRRAGDGHYVQLMAGESFMPPTQNPLEIRYVLAPGSYVMEIAPPDQTTLGEYTLRTALDATASCFPLVFITTGVTIRERIDQVTDCTGPFGGKEDWYIMLPDSNIRVDLTLATSEFAPILVFRDDRLGPASPTLSRDIRFNVGDTARTAFTTFFTGFHEIVVGHADANGSGDYVLTVGTTDPTSTCTPMPTTIGGQIIAAWELTDCASSGRIIDRYPVQLEAQTAFRTRLRSNAAVTDKGTAIWRDGGELLSLRRMEEGDQEIHWFLTPGSYEIVPHAAPTGVLRQYILWEDQALGTSLGCRQNVAMAGVTFEGQTLGEGDCTFNGAFEDRVLIRVEAGRQITVTMDAAAAPLVAFRNADENRLLSVQPRSEPGLLTATWTAETTAYYEIIFTTSSPNVSTTWSGSITVQ